MFVPHSYGTALALMVTSMVAWGSWANAQKVDPRLRFELFYWDYMWALAACAVAAALTLGRTHPAAADSFFNNLRAAAPRKAIDALAAGAIFNAGNILLVAAIALGGMAVAFPIGAGLGLVIGATLNYIVRPVGNAVLLFSGIALVCAAIVLDGIAYRSLGRGGSRHSSVIPLSIASGVLIGLFYPLVAKALNGPGKLTPYTVLVVFAIGAVASNLPLNNLLMRHPVAGRRLAWRDYARLRWRTHALGWIAGAAWTLGTTFNFVASSVPAVGPAVSFSLGEGNTLVSALWGIVVWHEFRGAALATRVMLGFMFLCFAIGLIAIALAPVLT
jgi:glucose uptake protein